MFSFGYLDWGYMEIHQVLEFGIKDFKSLVYTSRSGRSYSTDQIV